MKRTRLRKVGSKGSTHKRMHEKWRKLILRRDGAVCARCGTRAEGAIYQAHHVYPKSTYPRMRYHLPNGIVLCKACHCWITHNATGFQEVALYQQVLTPERLVALDMLSRDRSKARVDLKAIEIWLDQELEAWK